MGFLSKSDQIHHHYPPFVDQQQPQQQHHHHHQPHHHQMCERHAATATHSKSAAGVRSSRLSRLSAFLFGACIWAEKARDWHQQHHHQQSQPPYQRISRSRRKGADLATGSGRDTALQRGEARANGVCPVPDTNGPSACTSTGQKKAMLIPSFSQTASAQTARKVVQSTDNNCVADSVDEQMLDKLCTLPRGLDRHEWLATHVLALFEHVNCISATLSEVCTPMSCSTMSFPGNSKAQWVDERGKRHNYSAMRYIDSVMALCEGSRKNQQMFPTKYGAAFTVEFEQHCARMVRLLWHCAGHAYAKHWEHLNTLNLRLQFGLVMAHMAKLAKLYALLSDKELSSLVHTLQLARPSIVVSNSGGGTTATTTTAASSDCCNESAPTVAAFVQHQQQPQHRPTKRALLEDNGGNNNNNEFTTTGAPTADVLVCRTNTSF